ncbi:MAG: NGG1p interacting factor NIF3 [Candidatus Omnitrophota bacterium]
MKLKKLYDLIVEKGIDQDPRGKAKVVKELVRTKKQFEKLSDQEKEEFDLEQFKNPYSDTRILFGTGEEEIKKIIVGVDIETSEILLADRLMEKGRKIDLIMGHHPEGRALAALHQVMYMQADMANLRGVPINIAESLIKERMHEVERRLLPVNHTRSSDAARLLGIPFMCVHTPADNHVNSFLQKLMDRKSPDTIGDVIDVLREIPEYKDAIKNNAGPKIFNGSKPSRTGKIFVDMTGGTGGSKDIYKSLAQAGVGTVIGMHIGEEHLKKAKKEHVNVVIAGHISSDTLGLNLILDAIEKTQKLDIIGCSGFSRLRRK